MTIIDQITRCAAEYEISTGMKPTRVYLGRKEMFALWKWTYDAKYKTDPTTTRPEIMGLLAYEVNDDEPHMRCCV